MTRFNDPVYLEDWKNNKVFPKIHNSIFTLFSTTYESESVMDMCCSTGLLGQHVLEFTGIDVVAVEADPESIRLGRSYGISYPILNMWITPATLDEFCKYIKVNKVTGILARRCLSELFGDRKNNAILWDWADQWCKAIIAAGVKELWLEGRADQGRSVHPVPDTETEVKCVEKHFEVQETYNKAVYLKAK